MKPARVASSVIMAGLVAACSSHPIQIGRTNYVSPRMPVRTLVETPPSAAIPMPPTPELRPGSVAGLEQLRAAGDANAELLAADTPQATTPDMASNDTTAVSGADTAGTATSGATSSTVPSSTAPSSTASSSTASSSTSPSSTAMSVTPVQPGTAQAPAADSVTVASNDDDPDHLVGLSEADALRLLGKPKSRADTPPSRIWTYSSTTCDLRLFFYPEIGGTSYRTLTYEIDDRDPTDSNRRSCVGGLLKNHAS